MCSLYFLAGVLPAKCAPHIIANKDGRRTAATLVEALHLHPGRGGRLLDGLHHSRLCQQVFAQRGAEA